MRQESIEFALLATARIACCSVLVGTVACKNKTGPKSAEPEVPQNVETEQVTIEPTEPRPKVQAPVEAPPFPDGFDSCEETLQMAFSAESTEPTEPSDAAKECCTQYTTHLDSIGKMSGIYQVECCDILKWQGSRACTPWGPPTPPSFSQRA